MRILFLLLCCFAFSRTLAQNNLQIGYQEFATTVLGHASDAEGNMYYTGHFKGQLTVNGTVLTQGGGLDDLFWVKTTPNGEVIKYKTFSSPNTDNTVDNGLSAINNGHMYLISSSFGDVQFDQQLISAYSYPNSKSMNTVAKVDTAGNVKWVRRTTTKLLKVLASQNLVHVVGLSPAGSPVRAEDSTLLNATEGPSLIYMVYDTSGKLLNSKVISGVRNDAFFSMQNLFEFNDGMLLFNFGLQSNSHFKVNGTSVALTSANGRYHILLRTDTSFTNFHAKILNPALQSIYGHRSIILPADLAATDSIYTVMSPRSDLPYSIDGYDIPNNQNTLVVFDRTLTVKRTAFLGSALAASDSPVENRRKVYFRSIKAINNDLYFTGLYIGLNDTPLDVIPAEDNRVSIIGNATGTVNLNGASKSFVARTSLDQSRNIFNWLGEHTPYELTELFPLFIHQVNDNRLVFLMNADNTWNPWVVDTSLAIRSGAMKKNADRPDVPQLISFFPDGSKVMLSFASGNTALDTGNKITSNATRQDLFFSCFNPNGSVRWHHRIVSTLSQPRVRKMVVHNGKVWFLGTYSFSTNHREFFKVDTTMYEARINAAAALLCSIEPDGKIAPINLPQNLYKDGFIQGFSFFKNGDLAVLMRGYPVFLPGFPSDPGFYILRVNPESGALIEARKIMGTGFPDISHIEIDTDDNIYISGSLQNPGSSVVNLSLHDGTSFIDNASFAANTTTIQQACILKMNWSRIFWVKRTYGNPGAILSTQNNLFLVNNQPVLALRSGNNTQPLFWEAATVHNGLPTNFTVLSSIDSAGQLVRSRHLPITINFIRKGSNENLYVSGYANVPVQIDTIQVGNAGGFDGIALVLDSLLKAQRLFRIASPYTELNYDMDIFSDSVVALAYVAQTTPNILTSRTMVKISDFEPNAYFTTLRLQPSVTLPVRWMGFEAKLQGASAAALSWQVEGQGNGDFFDVEHSTSDGNFSTIAQVKAHRLQNRYTYIHSSPALGKANYYRIRHVEGNGRYRYSPLRLIGFDQSTIFGITPNPAGNMIRVETNKELLNVTIYDQSGHKVLSTVVSAGSEVVNISSLSKGMYVAVAQSNGTTIASVKFIKQ